MKVGILGGTFDPVHRGHTFTAHGVMKAFDLDQVLFMVCNLAPHKIKVQITSHFHRYAMVALALLEEERLSASLLEIEQGGPSYTVTTLKLLQRLNPDDRFCFIAGSDSLREIHLWKDYATLLSEHSFVFVQRTRSEVDLTQLKIKEAAAKTIKVVSASDKPIIQTGQSFLIDIQPPPVSSTGIREGIASGRCLDPEGISTPVLQYIRKYRLYEGNQSRSVEGLPPH